MGKHFGLIQSVDLVPLRLELTSVHLTTVMACVMTPDGPYRYSVIPELFWYRYINSGLHVHTCSRDGKNVSSISVLSVFPRSFCPPRNPKLSCDVLKSISRMWLGRDFGQTRGKNEGVYPQCILLWLHTLSVERMETLQYHIMRELCWLYTCTLMQGHLSECTFAQVTCECGKKMPRAEVSKCQGEDMRERSSGWTDKHRQTNWLTDWRTDTPTEKWWERR